jgi:hypothetical protein
MEGRTDIEIDSVVEHALNGTFVTGLVRFEIVP